MVTAVCYPRHSGSYGKDRACSSRFCIPAIPLMTCGLGIQARSIIAKHSYPSIDGIFGEMDSKPWHLVEQWGRRRMAGGTIPKPQHPVARRKGHTVKNA